MMGWGPPYISSYNACIHASMQTHTLQLLGLRAPISVPRIGALHSVRVKVQPQAGAVPPASPCMQGVALRGEDADAPGQGKDTAARGDCRLALSFGTRCLGRLKERTGQPQTIRLFYSIQAVNLFYSIRLSNLSLPGQDIHSNLSGKS